MTDETQAKPLELLAEYRTLCEAVGAARASDTPIPRALRDQLARVEAELQTRLWLTSAEPSSRGRGVPLATAALSDQGQVRQSFVEAVGTGASGGPGRAQRPAPTTVDSHSELPKETAGRAKAPTTGPADLEYVPFPDSAAAMVYCDGACIGNPGPGGYCAIVRVPGQPERVISGGKARTTNNEMELTAAAEGLKLAVSQGASEITVVSDSEYLVKGMSSWLRSWLRGGWKTSKGEPVKNRGLWEELHRLSQGRSVSWSWVRGHVGHPENERCDALAVAAAKRAARG